MSDESQPTNPEAVDPDQKPERTVGQYRLLGIGMIVVAAIGGLIWWLLVSSLHVNIVPLGAGAVILALAGAVTVWTGLK